MLTIWIFNAAIFCMLFLLSKNCLCMWISAYPFVENNFFLNIPHFLWIWKLVNMYLTYLEASIKCCTIRASLKKFFFLKYMKTLNEWNNEYSYEWVYSLASSWKHKSNMNEHIHFFKLMRWNVEAFIFNLHIFSISFRYGIGFRYIGKYLEESNLFSFSKVESSNVYLSFIQDWRYNFLKKYISFSTISVERYLGCMHASFASLFYMRFALTLDILRVFFVKTTSKQPLFKAR